MKVHEIMTAHARCVSPENTLVEAAGLMREIDVGSLPVCDDDRLLGIITDRDMAIRAIAQGRDTNTTTVGEIMTPDATFVMADDAVEQAARVMQKCEIRRLPVLSRERRLVGIVALADMAISSHPAFAGLTLREISQPVRPNGRDRRREMLGRSAAGAMTATAVRQEGAGTDGASERDGGSEGAAPSHRRKAPAAKGATKRTRGASGKQTSTARKRTSGATRRASKSSKTTRSRRRRKP